MITTQIFQAFKLIGQKYLGPIETTDSAIFALNKLKVVTKLKKPGFYAIKKTDVAQLVTLCSHEIFVLHKFTAGIDYECNGSTNFQSITR